MLENENMAVNQIVRHSESKDGVIASYREVLKFYTDRENYKNPLSGLIEAGQSEVMKDKGERARRELGNDLG